MFNIFAQLVYDRLRSLVGDGEVFESNVGADLLWLEYLGAFPEGTDPLYIARTEHDCNCCKSFIRGIGSFVRINGENFETIWDTAAEEAPAHYRIVAKALQKAVRDGGVKGIYRRTAANPSYGTQSNVAKDDRGFPKRDSLGNMIVWNHFWSDKLPACLMVSDGAAVGAHQARMATFKRSCLEISEASIATVSDLIGSNSIYRGQEFSSLVGAFRVAQHSYLANPSDKQAALVALRNPAAASFRTTVIGTLAGDLSGNVALEDAVRAYEAKVAPSNYRRTSAVVTPAMVKSALKTISDLGIEGSLERRTAMLADVSIRDVLWADGAAKQIMKASSSLENLLMGSVVKKPVKVSTDATIEMSLDQFVSDILPTASSLEVLVENHHLNNLMVLTAPKNNNAPNIFAWSNPFGWHYAGGVTDSIKERVKLAGGNVEGEVRVSLSWFNYDDLDLHMDCSSGHLYYGNRSVAGAKLDVDMNVSSSGGSRNAVENIFWEKACPGNYRFEVRNYTLRERCDVGFNIQIEAFGKIQTLSYKKMVGESGWSSDRGVSCFNLIVKNDSYELKDIHPDLISETRAITRWGLKSGDFVRVATVMNSPNYWGGAIGNKHTFFMIDGVQCDEEVRGLYNEFLSSTYNVHRKVFELVGEKTKSLPEAGHLAGLGFSSTVSNTVVLRVRSANGSALYRISTKELS